MDLVTDVLSPRDFRAAWAHALAEAFGAAREATTAARETAALLESAAHSETGLVQLARRTVADSIKAVDAQCTRLERDHLAQFELRIGEIMSSSSVAIEASVARIDSVVAQLEAAAERADKQLAELERERVAEEVRRQQAALDDARRLSLSLWGRLFGQGGRS